MIMKAIIVDKNALCAKWMPRKGPNAIKLRTHMGMTPKAFRKTLVGLTDVVETNMCAKEWDGIDFGKLPSLASGRYQKAFNKNATDRYAEYKAKLESGEATINAGAVYPYDIINSMKRGDAKVSSAQWKAQPDYMEGSTERIIPLVDVSGSMCCGAGGSSAVSCLDVAISLGLYISERTESIFKDKFITFSSNPELVTVSGSLEERYNTMARSSWGMSTDLTKAFELILDAGVMYDVPEKDMPTKLLILSDMQFNGATRRHESDMGMIRRKYEEAGYKLPDIIFWNINASGGSPVTFDSKGTALVSGCSPSIMTSILGGDGIDPTALMNTTILNERYDWM